MDLEFYGRVHEARPGMTYGVFTAMTSCVNLNFDAWPVCELAKSYETFVGCPVFVEHMAERSERARGAVVDAELVLPDGTGPEFDGLEPSARIDLLIEIDGQAFPMLAREVAEGGLDSVSMGADVEATECSVCGNVAYDPGDVCDHVEYARGGLVAGQRVYEVCRGVTFCEISIVFDPADPDALVSTVAAFDAGGRRVAGRFPPSSIVYDDPVDIEGISYIDEELASENA